MRLVAIKMRKLFSTARSKPPRFAPIYHQRGVSYLQLGLYEASKRALSRSIDLNPIPGEPWWERCRVNRILGDLEAALFDCRGAAARIDDQKPYAYMSAIHLDKSDTDDAKRVLKAGIKRLEDSRTLAGELLRLSEIDNTTSALIAWLKTEGARSKHRTKWLLLEAFVQDQLKNQRAAKRLRRQALRTATRPLENAGARLTFTGEPKPTWHTASGWRRAKMRSKPNVAPLSFPRSGGSSRSSKRTVRARRK